MINRFTGETITISVPKPASTPFFKGQVVYPNGAGSFSTSTAFSATPIGVCQEDISAANADFATTRKVAIDVPLANDLFIADVAVGEVTTDTVVAAFLNNTVVGKTFNLNSAKTHIDISTANNNGELQVVSLSGNKVVVKFNHNATKQPLINSGNTAARMLSGRMGAFDNTTPKTFRVTLTLAQHFDAIRVIFVNGATGGGYTVAGCNARVLANLTDALPTPTTVTLPSSGVLPVSPSSTRRSYLLSDWIPLSSVPRTDGGIFPLLNIDAYVSSASSISIMGNGSNDNFANWATRPNGRIWRMRHNDGDCVTTPANFVSTTDRIQSPIAGIQYSARGKVITVMGLGDSITDGRGTYIGEGFGVPACEAISDINGVAVEWANLGWAGASSNTWASPAFEDVIAAGIVPDAIVFSGGSPNDLSSPAITAANINICRQHIVRTLRNAQLNKVVPFIWTILPVEPGTKDFNGTDALRREHNDYIRSLASRGVNILDFDREIAGNTDSDGQVLPKTGTMADGIHPGDVGNAALSLILQAGLKRYI